ncbi:hypothetical protein Bbelb_195820 [Branchiostoma belcheri]|nr:hypothetical protein Bbelb_195820 [Branchiostoma belcheri]
MTSQLSTADARGANCWRKWFSKRRPLAGEQPVSVCDLHSEADKSRPETARDQYAGRGVSTRKVHGFERVPRARVPGPPREQEALKPMIIGHDPPPAARRYIRPIRGDVPAGKYLAAKKHFRQLSTHSLLKIFFVCCRITGQEDGASRDAAAQRSGGVSGKAPGLGLKRALALYPR